MDRFPDSLIAFQRMFARRCLRGVAELSKNLNLDGAVKSRFLMRVGWVIIVHVYFTRPTDRRIV